MKTVRFGQAICLALLIWSAQLTGHTVGQDAPEPVLVFILAGQSNMEGKGSVETMTHQLNDPEKRERFAHLQQDEQWVERDDVWIDYLGGAGRRHGPLTVGYGISKAGSQRLFGPELGFGWTLGDHFEQPILIIKTAWGGKSLDRDFRPPSAGYPESLDQMFENASKRKPELTREQFQQTYGFFYRQMMAEVKTVLSDLKTYVPGYQDQGYQLGGFVWFQGWNDQYAPTSVQDYGNNMSAFIRDVRKDLNQPNLPFVIGAMGHGGEKQSGKIRQIASAQIAVAQADEFRASVTTIPTTLYWDMEADQAFQKYWADKDNRDVEKWRQFGNDRPYHYLGSPVFFYAAGVGFGEAMIDLMENK